MSMISFRSQGQINTVVIGVGRVPGMGEERGCSFGAMTLNVGKNGERVVVVASTADLTRRRFQGHQKTRSTGEGKAADWAQGRGQA